MSADSKPRQLNRRTCLFAYQFPWDPSLPSSAGFSPVGERAEENVPTRSNDGGS